MKKKYVLLALAAILVVSATIGGTMAWLTDETEEVKNVFTVGNIDITLSETDNLNFKMVPGSTIAKDPEVTVYGGSEACWLFVKIDESTNLDEFISYVIAAGWTQLPEQANVYYRKVSFSASEQTFNVLQDNNVSVLSEVTKADMEGLKDPGATQPTLTFTAYAVQTANINDDAGDAWDIANP